jgi:hypothetical protein
MTLCTSHSLCENNFRASHSLCETPRFNPRNSARDPFKPRSLRKSAKSTRNVSINSPKLRLLISEAQRENFLNLKSAGKNKQNIYLRTLTPSVFAAKTKETDI